MSSSSILNIGEKVLFDDSIESIEFHPYTPYNDSFKNNDNIHICINRQDLILLPSQSQILVEGTVEKGCLLVNNGAAFLFQDIRYELNGVEIDRARNCGITSTIKGLISYTKEMDHSLQTAGWEVGAKKIHDKFTLTIPLSHFLGFAEDYKKVIMNGKHELILNRASIDVNCLDLAPVDPNTVPKPPTPNGEIEITRVTWRMPVIKVSDKEKLRLMSYVEGSIPVQIAFRTWELYEYPVLPSSERHIWCIKTSTQLEKPRYLIVGFQTARRNDKTKDMSIFDHCNLTNCRVYLNAQYYPYDPFSAEFKTNNYALLYDAFTNFQRSYYSRDHTSPQVNYAHYKTHSPLIVIDTSRQCDSFNSGAGAIDIKLEMEFKENVPANTTAYCLIINDSLFEYNALTSATRKIIQ
ncbi:uncharacterized protein LOC133523126 [Cydia pomonella]|uniref:uncharacterized protein LOC133521013 n=1 Tax=Cydia pomonella TaxID=82600 RepID=UPI002ADE1F99|nr:uncharacterized protein LOC133521013 [Cydia pomonella]XP_061712775.1 uncharacterized protein LOC133521727 [Cydia pomonella]XP_061714621.1 uncharacterized protein LOC133523126 [Cydia pomonella]